MKKILLVSLIGSSLLFGEYRYTKIDKKIDESQYTSGELEKLKYENIFGYDISGNVFNVTKYSSHTRVIIEDKEKGRVKLSINPNVKINDKNYVNGNCKVFEYDVYSKCILSIK